MEFLILDNLNERSRITDSSNVLRFNQLLTDNLNYTRSYYKRTDHRFNNDFFLNRLLGTLFNYIGRTPLDTYENTKDNLRYITSLYNIAAIASEQSTHDVLLGKDILASNTHEVNFNEKGYLDKAYDIFKLHYHDMRSLTFNDYIKRTEDFNSIIGIDIPLMAATWHQEYVIRAKTEEPLTTDKFLTTYLYSRNMIKQCLNYALLNRLELRAMEIPDRYNSTSTRLPYAHRDVDFEYYRIEEELVSKIRQTSNSTLEYLVDNVCFLVKPNDLLIKIDDYYVHELMFINASVECALYRKLDNFNKGFDLGINTQAYDNRLINLLGSNRHQNLVKHLYKDVGEHYAGIIDF